MGDLEIATLGFEVFTCYKDVCPVVTFEDFDRTGCCPLCGTLGTKAPC